MSSKAKAAPEAPAAAPAPPPVEVAAPVSRFTIRKDVPLPIKRHGNRNGGEMGYPFDILEVNDSFFVPSREGMKEPWKTLTSLTSRKGRELHPKQFTTARDTEDGVEGVRIWRIKDRVGDLKPPRANNRKAKEAADASDAPPPSPAPGAPPPPPPAA